MMVSDGKSTTLQHQLESDACACCTREVSKKDDDAHAEAGSAAGHEPVTMAAHRKAAARHREALAGCRARVPALGGGTQVAG